MMAPIFLHIMKHVQTCTSVLEHSPWFKTLYRPWFKFPRSFWGHQLDTPRKPYRPWIPEANDRYCSWYRWSYPILAGSITYLRWLIHVLERKHIPLLHFLFIFCIWITTKHSFRDTVHDPTHILSSDVSFRGAITDMDALIVSYPRWITNLRMQKTHTVTAFLYIFCTF